MKVKLPRTASAPAVEQPQTPHRDFRLLVCGSRDWTDVDTINKHVLKAVVESGARTPNVLIINGGAPGADSIIKDLCERELGFACMTFMAPWVFAQEQLGAKRKAGPLRNMWMIRWGMPDLCLAFHPYMPGSRDTKHLVSLCREAGIPVRIVEK
jgi:hypothetical protein